MKMKNVSIVFISALLVFNIAAVSAEDIPMRGVILDVNDLSTVDWAKLAHENGINTIGTHIFPKQVADFVQTEKGKKFLADCKKYGIKVEHQLHAMSDLLPRELFEQDPSMFRMTKDGERVQKHNFCVHSEKALGIVVKNAVDYAKMLPPDNHRYYFWLDDGAPVCECPACSKYSPSEQALIVENRIIKELRKFNPKAQLAHLAYHTSMSAPRKVKPEPGIFLEFAPIHRTWDKPLSDTSAKGTRGKSGVYHKDYLRHLQDNLTVFPAETAVVLEYWLDVSLFSNWKKPAVKLPWNKAVCEDDLKTYASFGIRNFTTFAVYVDDNYLKNHNSDLQFLKEYGELLNNLTLPAVKTQIPVLYTVKTIPPGLITLDAVRKESAWNDAEKLTTFVNPWNPSVQPATSLQMLKDDKFLYFFFEAKDDEIVLVENFSKEDDVIDEDRVEFMFAKDAELKEYYSFEMDPKGRTLDYTGSYYRQFDFDWNMSAGYAIHSEIQSDGYTVEGKMPLGFLNKMMQDDGTILFSAFRAEFSKKDGKIVENWLTVKDSLTFDPDFHVPSSLGKLKFD
ncbi:MAG: DUF4838 domain-containing protein [Planctomycetaceae bacterium]|nr:DUF4838 domain-containing protein [Planctomycetaceae bacterium]